MHISRKNITEIKVRNTSKTSLLPVTFMLYFNHSNFMKNDWYSLPKKTLSSRIKNNIYFFNAKYIKFKIKLFNHFLYTHYLT